MEFVIKRCPPDPAVAIGLGRSFVITATEIRDENGTLLGHVECRAREGTDAEELGIRDYSLWQRGVITSVFTRIDGRKPEFWFTYDGMRMSVQPWNHFLCDEIQARTVLPWYPPGQCLYSVSDSVDPVSALFLFQMLENLDDEELSSARTSPKS